MKKFLIGVLTILIILAVIAGIWFWLFRDTDYSAVYLRTGDIYFGKITRFPAFGLKSVYLIQTNPQDTNTPFSVQKFPRVFWGPEDYIKINKKEVVWTAKLDKNGQLAQLLKTNPELNPQNSSGGTQDLLDSGEETVSGTAPNK